MKKRATKKVDISAKAKQFDIRGTILLEVLVGPDGRVVCTHSVIGHPLLMHEVQDAVQQWIFAPLNEGKTAVAYVGHLDFLLCNTGCDTDGQQMTLLK